MTVSVVPGSSCDRQLMTATENDTKPWPEVQRLAGSSDEDSHDSATEPLVAFDGGRGFNQEGNS